MTVGELRALVSGGESDRVEFKKTTGQRSDGAKTASARLNGEGEFVFFGVTDAGEIRGQKVTTKTIEDVVYELRKIEPQPLLSPERIPLDSGQEVIGISVPGRTGGPYTYDGRPYVRQGPVTTPMSQDDYRRLLLERAHPAH